MLQLHTPTSLHIELLQRAFTRRRLSEGVRTMCARAYNAAAQHWRHVASIIGFPAGERQRSFLRARFAPFPRPLIPPPSPSTSNSYLCFSRDRPIARVEIRQALRTFEKNRKKNRRTRRAKRDSRAAPKKVRAFIGTL